MGKSGKKSKPKGRPATETVMPILAVLSLLTGLGQLAATNSAPALFVFSLLLEITSPGM
jgi:hypothetical protein